MTTAIRDDEIFDILNYADARFYDRATTRLWAGSQGYKYVSWCGCIHNAKTDEVIFYPPQGICSAFTPAFNGWKNGYSYRGHYQWLFVCKKAA
jgi:hypothetical protein